MSRRLSLGTPHRLSREEQIAALATLSTDPVLRADVLALMHLTEGDWDAMPGQARLMALATFENQAAYAAVWAKAAEARRRLTGEADVIRGIETATPAVGNAALLDAITTLIARIEKLEADK